MAWTTIIFAAKGRFVGIATFRDRSIQIAKELASFNGGGITSIFSIATEAVVPSGTRTTAQGFYEDHDGARIPVTIAAGDFPPANRLPSLDEVDPEWFVASLDGVFSVTLEEVEVSIQPSASGA